MWRFPKCCWFLFRKRSGSWFQTLCKPIHGELSGLRNFSYTKRSCDLFFTYHSSVGNIINLSNFTTNRRWIQFITSSNRSGKLILFIWCCFLFWKKNTEIVIIIIRKHWINAIIMQILLLLLVKKTNAAEKLNKLYIFSKVAIHARRFWISSNLPLIGSMIA